MALWRIGALAASGTVERMRLFIEASLDDAALDAAWAAGRALTQAGSVPERSVRWVKRSAFHLTLRFLGEIEEDRVPEIVEALGELEGSGRFELSLNRIGCFGGRRPRVIWVGVAPGQGLDRLSALRGELDLALGAAGIGNEQEAFRPHLTLGRVRRQASRTDRAQIRESVDRAEALDIDAVVERVALVHSTLLTDGPRYRRLALADL